MNKGNQSNYRKYKFAVQGRYMDWVANGHKYEVERNFVSLSMRDWWAQSINCVS